MDAADSLRQLGFGEYESKAYLALLQHGALNGYEVAKAAGVPRPNVYGVLQRLEERGAVLRANVSAGIRYQAVAPSELLKHLGAGFRTALAEAGSALGDIVPARQEEYAWNLKGYEETLRNARALLDGATTHALVAIRQPEAAALRDALRGAEAQGTELTTLCLQGCPEKCGACRGHIHRHPVQTTHDPRWLVIVADGAEMLAAEVEQGERTWAVRSRQPLLVEMATWYVRQTVAQAAVLSDLRGREEETLSPETLALLADTGSKGPGSRFVSHIRRLMKREKEQGG